MEYRDMTTTLLAYELLSSIHNGDSQQNINMAAYELACRFCNPSQAKIFEQTLKSFGYKKSTNNSDNIISRHIGR